MQRLPFVRSIRALCCMYCMKCFCKIVLTLLHFSVAFFSEVRVALAENRSDYHTLNVSSYVFAVAVLPPPTSSSPLSQAKNQFLTTLWQWHNDDVIPLCVESISVLWFQQRWKRLFALNRINFRVITAQ